MATKFIANEDLKVKFTNIPSVPPLPPDLVYSGDPGIDAVKIVAQKSTNCKAKTKLICTTNITMLFAVGPTACPFTSATYTFIAGGGSILATAIKCKADAQFVLRKDDAGTCAGTWKLTASPFTVVPCACTVKISDAGQDKVKGN